MEWIFYLDDTEIEEPKGFADEFAIAVNRDENTHGVMFEASVSHLEFYGAAADYLEEKKRTRGLKAEVRFRAQVKCGDGPYDPYETAVDGKLNFGQYKKTCGNSCIVSMNVEQGSCAMTLKNRYDQKVDLASTLAFDQVTALAPYEMLNMELELPAKDLLASVEGYVAEGGDTMELLDGVYITGYISIRPLYINERFNSIDTGSLGDPTSNIQFNDIEGGPLMTPQLLWEDNLNCFNQSASYGYGTQYLNYTVRLKGNYSVVGDTGPGDGAPILWVKLKFVRYKPLNSGDLLNVHADVFHEETLFIDVSENTYSASGSYDETWNGTFEIQDGAGHYAFIEFAVHGQHLGTMDITNTFDPETYINIYANKSCPATDATVSLINETLSRVTEAITDNCLKVKSDYYGRGDSEPYSSDNDGCGSLRALTSGLHIRKAETPKFFASLKELFEGLKAIDNIGMGIEPNPNIPGYDWLRIEAVEYFYQEKEILRLPYVPSAEIAIDESKHYSIIKVGYKKWEAERVQGLDEPNSNKEYRTSLKSVSNTLDVTSGIITGSYVIETTRQQSFAGTGGADTKFDNDIFLICLDRLVYGFQVEQGNIDSAANIYSPQTLYNWRVRPYYNLMRWFKSAINSYPNLFDTENKLFFGAGTGNILATGEIIQGLYDPDGCKLENGPKAENRNLAITDFAEQAEGVPLWKPELAKFKYRLSIAEYNKIKANPYGYIAFSCGNTEDFLKGYVKQVQYKPSKGEAEFLLIMKWP